VFSIVVEGSPIKSIVRSFPANSRLLKAVRVYDSIAITVIKYLVPSV